MAIKVEKMTRDFVFNNIHLPDPNPELPIEKIREIHAMTYPEISTAAVEGRNRLAIASGIPSAALSARKGSVRQRILLFPTEMPEPPYAEALRELTAITQGFADDPSVLLVREHDSCPQAQQLSKVLSEASSRVRGPYLDGVTLLYPPPGILPPLI